MSNSSCSLSFQQAANLQIIPKRKRPSPLSIRLSEAEHKRLKKAAKGQPLSTYVKSRLFDQNAPLRRDKTAVAQILGKLGKSGLGSDFSVMVEAIRIGALPVTEETEVAINAACSDIRQIKSLLMTALRIKEN